jgi:hypothetical protein
MSTTSLSSNTSHNSDGSGWRTLRRQPKKPEAAEDLGLPKSAPYYPNPLRNRIILGIVLIVVIVGVSVGVVLSKNGVGGNKTVVVENQTVAVNETSAPSASPVTSTVQPTAAPSVLSVVDQFLSGLPPYSMDLAEGDPDSAQAKALVWLESDPQYTDYELHRLNQRYALAVLFYSTNDYYYYYHGDSWWDSSGWMSNGNECTWYQYNEDGTEDDNSCTESSRLSALNVWGHMHGSIPAELELLTDVEYMRLSGEALSGTIPSEL